MDAVDYSKEPKFHLLSDYFNEANSIVSRIVLSLWQKDLRLRDNEETADFLHRVGDELLRNEVIAARKARDVRTVEEVYFDPKSNQYQKCKKERDLFRAEIDKCPSKVKRLGQLAQTINKTLSLSTFKTAVNEMFVITDREAHVPFLDTRQGHFDNLTPVSRPSAVNRAPVSRGSAVLYPTAG